LTQTEYEEQTRAVVAIFAQFVTVEDEMKKELFTSVLSNVSTNRSDNND